MKTIISEKFVDLYYDEKIPCFIIHWKGFQKLELVKPFCEKVITIFREEKEQTPNLIGIIGNTLDLKAVTEDVQDYWNQEWNQAMYEIGGRYLALIVPNNIFGKFSLDKYASSIQKNIKGGQIRFFDDINKSKEWLESLQTENQVK